MIDVIEILTHWYAGRSQNELATSLKWFGGNLMLKHNDCTDRTSQAMSFNLNPQC